jgi:DNA-binding response OmpR family regulator
MGIKSLYVMCPIFMKKILFIEDDPKLVGSLEEIFKRENYEFLAAANGEDGLATAKKEKPDLILLDLVLPQKDGFEVLKEIKNDSETASIPVIILTNLEGSGDIEKALSLGANSYLIKANYSLEEVLVKVKEILSL